MNNISTTDEVVIDIQEDDRNDLLNSLDKLLINLQVHCQNTKIFHWHVSGSNFFVLHEKFEELYRETAAMIDETAERMLVLDGRPGTGLDRISANATISDGSQVRSADKMIEFLINSNKMLISNVINVIKLASQADDEGTIDTFTGYLSSLQKTNWMLKAFLG